MQTVSLFELNEHLRRVIALNFQEEIWVRCEIAQVNESRGHRYLSLIEKKENEEVIRAQMDAVLWLRQYRRLQREHGAILPQLLQNGMAVLLKVTVDFDERFGLKLKISDIDPGYTVGQLELRRQQTLETLAKQGLLQANAKLRLPPVLQKIAIISSADSAGLEDFTAQLTNNGYGYQFLCRLFPAAMQGDRVTEEVSRQLKSIALQVSDFEAVVIIRGGGARLDLSAFDSLELNKMVGKMPLPVLAGIGHETDSTILDQTAHTSLKTPTAVAHFLVDRMVHFESAILQIKDAILQNGRHWHLHAQRALEKVRQLIPVRGQQMIFLKRQLLQQTSERLLPASRQLLVEKNNELQFLQRLFHLLTPEKTLQRGFSITKKEGKWLASVEGLVEGTALETVLADGTVRSIIKTQEK